MVVAMNLTPTPHERFRLPLPAGGPWHEALNSDAEPYGGSGLGNLGIVRAEDVPSHGRRAPRSCSRRSRASSSDREPPEVRVWPGSPYPQGATWDGEGVNFSCSPSTRPASTSACTNDPTTPWRPRIPITNRTDLLWHAYLRTCGPDACTATASADPTSHARATGSTRTSSSSTRTRAISGPVRHDAVYGYEIGPTRTSRSTAATARGRCRSAW